MNVRTRLSILILAVAIVGAGTGMAASASAEKRGTIVSTASIRGETKSCGCKKKDLGGLDRRATLINEERANGEILLVDAGDFGAHQNENPWARTTFQWDMMDRLQYDVVTVGPNELLYGHQQLTGLLGTHPEIQVVSANLTDKSGNLLFDEFSVVEKAGVTYAVTGVMSPSLYDFNKSRGLQEADDFAFQDVKDALGRVLPLMKTQAEVTVVLLHTSPADAKRLLTEMPGMDVVIVGHNPGYTFAPERIGQTLMVRPGARGQYTAVLTLTLDDDGGILDYDGQSRPIGKSISVDEEVLALVEAFEAEYGPSEATEEDDEGTR